MGHADENARPEQGASATHAATAASSTGVWRHPRPEDESPIWPAEQNRRVGGMLPLSFHASNNQQVAGMTARSRDAEAVVANTSDSHISGKGGAPGQQEAGGVWEEGRSAAVGHNGEPIETWRLGLRIGSELDVKDTVDKWCEAKVIDIDRGAERVLITYIYWSPKWDEWFDIYSPCLALPSTRTYQEGGPLRVGHRMDVLDEGQIWREADVVEERPDGSARVHFKNFHKKFDRWIWPHGGEVRQFGPHPVTAKVAGRGSSRKASTNPEQEHVRQIAQLSSRYEHYCRVLEREGLRVVPVEGDGNCLFRSVSHQVYGDDRHHGLVRARCMDYMESEAHFFEPYVEGDMADFMVYLNFKRRNAVWGDDPEVQALCEIYDRPAEIWAYDAQLGAKTLRTFHEAAGSASGGGRGARRPPMRLSYYGGGHYDSVSPIGPDDSGGAVAAAPAPGQLEDEALERSRRRAADAGSGRDPQEMKQQREDESLSEQSVMDHALAWSRNVFEAQFDDLDSALVASVDHMDQSNLNSLEAAARDSELVMIQEEMLRSVQAQSEEEQLRHALEASCNTAAAAADEANMVRLAIAESMNAGAGSQAAAAGAGEAGGVGVTKKMSAEDSAPILKDEGILDEEEELKRVLAISGTDAQWEEPPPGLVGVTGSAGSIGGNAGAGQHIGSGSEDFDEDAELREAIKASLAGGE